MVTVYVVLDEEAGELLQFEVYASQEDAEAVVATLTGAKRSARILRVIVAEM